MSKVRLLSFKPQWNVLLNDLNVEVYSEPFLIYNMSCFILTQIFFFFLGCFNLTSVKEADRLSRGYGPLTPNKGEVLSKWALLDVWVCFRNKDLPFLLTFTSISPHCLTPTEPPSIHPSIFKPVLGSRGSWFSSASNLLNGNLSRKVDVTFETERFHPNAPSHAESHEVIRLLKRLLEVTS